MEPPFFQSRRDECGSLGPSRNHLLLRTNQYFRTGSLPSRFPRTFDVTIIPLFLNEDGHRVMCCIRIAERFGLALPAGADSSPPCSHRVPGLRHLPEFARSPLNELEVADPWLIGGTGTF